MADPYRLIVTGSRDWPDPAAVTAALDAIRAVHWPLTVIHGACRQGPDATADQWVTRMRREGYGHSIKPERWPANWSQGIAAGPVRNRKMVEAGADLCIAFVAPCARPRCRRPQPHGSHGASGCADLAEAAGIETYRFTPQ